MDLCLHKEAQVCSNNGEPLGTVSSSLISVTLLFRRCENRHGDYKFIIFNKMLFSSVIQA